MKNATAVRAEHPTRKIIGYQLRDIIRSRWLVGYALFFLLVTDGLLRFGGADMKALLGVANIMLLVVPLASLVFGAMYCYNAREFVELLLAQPVSRSELFHGLYLGLTLPMAGAFALGVGLPVALHATSEAHVLGSVVTVLVAGIALTGVFTAIALLIAVRVEDKARGLGTAISLWLGLAVLYDGMVLLVTMSFADYPLERGLLGLMVLNPIDLARIAVLLRFDISALMGYTGAVFKSFFGGGGLAVAALALAVWMAVPVWLGTRAFQRKDF
jgi:Cu-processing system permease protein